MQRSVLSELSMDTAVSYNTGQEVASMVEDCTCPPGYTGLSCEVGFAFSDLSARYLKRCLFEFSWVADWLACSWNIFHDRTIVCLDAFIRNYYLVTSILFCNLPFSLARYSFSSCCYTDFCIVNYFKTCIIQRCACVPLWGFLTCKITIVGYKLKNNLCPFLCHPLLVPPGAGRPLGLPLVSPSLVFVGMCLWLFTRQHSWSSIWKLRCMQL